MANLPPKIDDIRLEALKAVFGGNMPQDMQSTLIFHHLKTFGGTAAVPKSKDIYGAEQSLERLSAPVSKYIYTQNVFKGSTVSSTSKYVGAGSFGVMSAGQNVLAQRVFETASDEFKLNLSWSKNARSFLARNYAGAENAAGFLGVSTITQRAFPELSPYTGKLESAFERVQQQMASSSAGPEMEFFRKSFQSFGVPLEQLSESQKIEGFFTASVLRMQAENRMEGLHSLMQQEGISIPGVQYGSPISSISSKYDPYGIQGIKKGIKSRGGIFAYKAGELPSEFYHKLKYFAGERFVEDIFKPFVENIYQRDESLRGKLQFVLSEEGGLYVGKGAFSESYVPLGYEYLDQGSTSEFGLAKGQYYSHGKITGIKRQVIGQQTVAGSQAIYRELEQNLQGLREENIPQALKGASRSARRQTKTLLSPVINRGELSLASSINAYIAVDPNVSRPISDIINIEASGAVAGLRTTAELQSRLRNAAAEGLSSMPQGASAFYMVASKSTDIALEGVQKYFPTSFVQQKEQIKGLHHLTRPLYITPERTFAMAKAKEKAGYIRQASTVGLLEGQAEQFTARFAQQQSQLGSQLGLGKGMVTGSYSMPVLAVDTTKLFNLPAGATLNAEIFGDPTIVATRFGRQMHQGIMRPMKGLTVLANRNEFVDILNAIGKGDYKKSPALQKIFEQITGQQEFSGLIPLSTDTRKALRGLTIGGKAFDLPSGARYITGIKYSDFDQSLSFSFAARKTPQVSLIAGSMRTTLIVPGEKAIGSMLKDPDSIYSRLFGGSSQLEEVVGGVTSFKTLEGMNQAYNRYFDLLELAGTVQGGPEAFAEKFNVRAAADKVKLKYSGTEVLYEKELQYSKNLIAEGLSNATKEEANIFFTRLEETLQQDFGLTRGAVEAEAIPRIQYLASRGIIGKQEAESILATAESSDLLKSAKLPFLSFMRREAEASELTKQGSGLRIRLSYLKTYLIGQQAMTGLTKDPNPIARRMVKEFRRQTGIISLEEAATEKGARKLKTLRLTKASLGGEQFAKEYAKKYNLRILSEKDAREILLNGEYGLKFTPGGAIEYTPEELQRSALFGAGRPADLAEGALIELENEIEIAVSKDKVIKTKYLPLYGTAEKNLLGLPKGPAGLTRALKKGGYAHSILTFLQQGEEGVESQTFGRGSAAEGISRFLRTAFLGQDKYIDKLFTTRKLKGSAAFRAVTKFGSDTNDLLQIATATKPIKQMFEVEIDESTLKRMYANQEEFAKVLGEFKENKFIYGIVKPDPFHHAGHQLLVKYKLAETLADASKTANEPYIRAGAFLTWLMNRDNDKDTIQGLIFSKHVGIGKGLKSKESKQLDLMFEKQLSAQAQNLEQFRREAKDISVKLPALKDFLESAAEGRVVAGEGAEMYQRYIDVYTEFLKFGRTPSVPYAGTYTVTPILEMLSSGASDQNTAKNLMSAFAETAKPGKAGLSKTINAETVTAIRQQMLKASGLGSIKEITSQYDLLGGNLKQAFIQKAGKYQPAALDFLNVGYEIATGGKGGTPMSLEASIERATQKSKTFFESLASSELDVGKLRLPGLSFEGLTQEEAIAKAAKVSGAALGSALHLIATHTTQDQRHAAMANQFRQLTRNNAESLMPMLSILAAEGSTQEVFQSPDYQRAVAQVNEATKTASREAGPTKSFDKSAAWLTKNWKIVGAVAGGLIGLRVVSDMLTEDEMERPPLKTSQRLNFNPAPLPPEPMVGRQMPSVDPSSLTRPRAYVQPVNGTYNRAQYSADYGTVNMNAMSFANESFGNINIQDSRSYTANWQMQNIADMAGDSDFIHPYMPLV